MRLRTLRDGEPVPSQTIVTPFRVGDGIAVVAIDPRQPILPPPPRPVPVPDDRRPVKNVPMPLQGIGTLISPRFWIGIAAGAAAMYIYLRR